MDVLETIKSRRSVREFLPSEVPWKDLELILDMARYAPSAGNAQPWKFLVVGDEENKAKLREAIKEFPGARMDEMTLTEEEKRERREGFNQFVEQIFMAPALIFFLLYARRHPELAAYDGALAVQNMMLAAHALGYGISFQTMIFPKELVKDHLSIPDDYKFMCAVPLGRPATRPEMPQKKELATFIWEERFPD